MLMAGAVPATDRESRILADPPAEISRCVSGAIFSSSFRANWSFSTLGNVRLLPEEAGMIGLPLEKENSHGVFCRIRRVDGRDTYLYG